MPLLQGGPLAGYYAPDYDGGSTVNLMATIVRARGGSSPHEGLAGLDQARLQRSHCILYLVLDGLGLHQLARHLERGQGQAFFAKHEHRSISTVFPATTAAAVTTFDTGASPTEHGILSWFLHLPDLGCVGTVLRTHTRVGTPLFPEGFDLRDYYAVPSYVETATDHRGLLSWGQIPNVPFGVVGTQWEDKRSYDDLDGLVETATRFSHESDRRFSYVYWPRYDGLCHEMGCDSDEVNAHFDDIDRAMAALVDGLQGTGTTLCVLADHGLVDVDRERCFDLARVPGLMPCLSMAPSGDQRQMSCFVRPGKVDAFHRVVAEQLGDVCISVPGEELLRAGVFGPGEPHPALESRVGDYVLLCRDDHAIIHTPAGLDPLYMPGSHGGMSEAEVLIPLYVVDA